MSRFSFLNKNFNSIYSRLEDEDYAALTKEPHILPNKHTLTNGSFNHPTPKRMLYPSVKTIGNTVVTNHQSKIATTKTNGNHLQPPEKLVSRRIPRLVRSPNVDDHNNNNNLLSNITTSYTNGLNGCNNNSIATKESHLKLLGHPNDLPNGDINGTKSTKLLRLRNSSILKSPNFRTRLMTNGDE